MSHVAVDTLLMEYRCSQTSDDDLVPQKYERICRRNACTSHADSCRIVVWECGSSICSQVNLVHMIGRGSRLR